MGGDAARTNLVVDGEDVPHLERRSLDRLHDHVDVDKVVEQQRLAIANPRLEHVHLDALVADLLVRMADVPEICDARLFEHREIAAVVDDPHRIGLGEPHPQPMGELVVGRIDGRVVGDAHGATIDLADILGGVTPALRELDAAAIPYVVHEYERGDSLHDFGIEAAEALGVEPDRVFKTLLVDVDGGHAVAIVPVSGRLGLKAVGRAVGGKRVSMCDPAVAERLTGYVRGGISPFGQKRRLPTVVDELATLFDTIYVSGGKRGIDIELAPDVLIAHLDAIVADIAA